MELPFPKAIPFAARCGHMTEFCAVDVGEHDVLLATLAHINLP